MKENYALIKKMVGEGLTYKRIGDYFCVSKQRIHQIFKHYNGYSLYRKHKRNGKYKLLFQNPCSICGSWKKLEVHHKDGHRNNNVLSNLERLCKQHHLEAEKKLFSNGTKIYNYTNRENMQRKVHCQICGKEYMKRPSEFKNSKYNLCSPSCRGRYRILA